MPLKEVLTDLLLSGARTSTVPCRRRVPILESPASNMRIACIHQGYELYGSDRSFAECVAAIRAAWPAADIEVVLPRPGPITSLLEGVATRIVFEPVFVLRRASLWQLALSGAIRLPVALVCAAKRFARSDLVYINTSVIADYAIAARFFRHKALLHIHEIPEGFTLKVLRALVGWSGADIIFNSRATRASYPLAAERNGTVIYNGVAGPKVPEPVSYDGTRPLRVAMLGRVNRIKGQEVLIEAVRLLAPELREKVQVRIIGSAFEDQTQETALAELVAQSGLTGEIALEPFTDDAGEAYRWADIVVVPSRRPESLGRVAIEAMSWGRPVISSAIGGLAEVVADGVTGWLVPPGDAAALSARLAGVMLQPGAWAGFAAAARQRYEALFSEATAAQLIAQVVAGKLAARSPPAHSPALVVRAEDSA